MFVHQLCEAIWTSIKGSISRWLKSVLILAGVDCSVYKPHIIRSAAVSKFISSMVPIDILTTAGWSSERTFAKFYEKKIDNTSTNRFTSAVLS